MEQILKNKRIVVVGALTGLGRSFAPFAVQEGAKVASISRTPVNNEKVSSLYEACDSIRPNMVKHFQADASDKSQITEAMEQAADFLGGGIDGLVLSIHSAHPGHPLDTITREQIMIDIDNSFFGDLYSCQAAFPYLSKNSSIVTFSANAVANVQGGSLPYVASKYCVVALTRLLAKEWAQYGVRANNILPITTTESTSFHPAHLDPEIYAVATHALSTIMVHPERNPWDRVPPPIEGAYLIAYLVSDYSAFVTDQVIHLDGGASRGTI